MTRNSTTPKYSNRVAIVNFIALLMVSIALGAFLSDDQSYSPFPSVGGLIFGLMVLIVCGAGVAYANYSSISNKKSPTRLYDSITTGLGAMFAGYLMASLVRMILII